MTIKKLPLGKCLCVICDDYADVSIQDEGSLKLFWACSPTDEEFTLCTGCLKELRDLINEVI